MEPTQLVSAMLPPHIEYREVKGQPANVIFTIAAADYNPNAVQTERFESSPISLVSFNKVSMEDAASHAMAALINSGSCTTVDISGGADYAEFLLVVGGNRILVSAGDVFELDTENCIATIKRHPENQKNHSRIDTINWQEVRCEYKDPSAKRKSEPTQE